MAKKDDYIIDDFYFSSKAEYERALKEKESMQYLISNTDMTDMKAVLKMYNRAVEKKSFQTIIGLEFMMNIRKRLVTSGIVEEKVLLPIPVIKSGSSSSTGSSLSADQKDAQIKKYKEAYEGAIAGRKIKNIVIVILAVIIIGMFVITYMSQYSVFTYFTDYKTKMENEIIDQYEIWESELEEREAAIEKKEAELNP